MIPAIELTIWYLEQIRPSFGSTTSLLNCADSLPLQGIKSSFNPPIEIRRWQPDTDQYRRLYRRVGDQYLWHERLLMKDYKLEAILDSPKSELYILQQGDHQLGYGEIHFDTKPGTANIAYFGLVSGQEQQGIGGAFMGQLLHQAWIHSSLPARVTLNTCSLDHPRALGFYQHVGFTIIRQNQLAITDPRYLFDFNA